MKLLPSFVLFLNSSFQSFKKTALNQVDNISIFQLCLLLKMRLSVNLEGRFTGYKLPIIALLIHENCLGSANAIFLIEEK